MTLSQSLIGGAALVLACGCSVDASPKANVSAAKKAAPAATAEPKPADTAEPADAQPVKPADAKSAQELGKHFRDPPWYRKTIFSAEQGSLVSESRSEADEQGRFKSHMVFELTSMTTAECGEHLSAAVKETVGVLEPAEKPGPRLELGGSTDRYNVTFICGEAKGKMRAYVAFEWTS